MPTPASTTSCDRYQGGWQHFGCMRVGTGTSPRALPDLCELNTDRDSAALRSTEGDILGNDTAPLAACRARPSIKSSYCVLVPRLSMGMKLPAGQTPPWDMVPRRGVPAPSEGSDQLPAQFRLEFRRLASRADQDRPAPAVKTACGTVAFPLEVPM